MDSLKLYLVTDSDILKDRNFYECIEEALKGGVTMLQLREKEAIVTILNFSILSLVIFSPYIIPFKNIILKIVPFPSSLSTVILPPLASIIFLLSDKPIPILFGFIEFLPL